MLQTNPQGKPLEKNTLMKGDKQPTWLKVQSNGHEDVHQSLENNGLIQWELKEV